MAVPMHLHGHVHAKSSSVHAHAPPTTSTIATPVCLLSTQSMFLPLGVAVHNTPSWSVGGHEDMCMPAMHTWTSRGDAAHLPSSGLHVPYLVHPEGHTAAWEAKLLHAIKDSSNHHFCTIMPTCYLNRICLVRLDICISLFDPQFEFCDLGNR